MWDLSLDATHTFAVGDIQAVVHNCPSGGDGVGDHRGGPGTDANEFEKRQGANLITETPEFDDKFSSSYQWTYESAEKSTKPMGNEIGHEARFSQRYYFKFWDEGVQGIREVSANFDPWAREWEGAAFHMSSGK